jgi:deoxyribodipyrimidine photo-lyase
LTGRRDVRLRTSTFPALRISCVNEGSTRPDGSYVLYWMTAFRRARYNFALQRALEWAHELRKPLIVLEALRVDYPWACDRFHRFVIDGMADNAAEFARSNVVYYPYVEPEHGAGNGLLSALAAHACAVVTDDFPEFFLQHAIGTAAQQLDVRLEAVDSNGIHTLRAPAKAFATAHDFRRWLQRNIHDDLAAFPLTDARVDAALVRGNAPEAITRRWPMANLKPDTVDATIGTLPIDHSVAPVGFRGGTRAAQARLANFIPRLARYEDERSHPDADGASRLSPYLHFGHISAHEVFSAVAGAEGWSMGDTSGRRDGGRSGFWGMSAPAEAFLDQLITWRELGFNFCAHRVDYDRYDSLPEWSRRTLEQHASDPRPEQYSVEQLEHAGTADPLWNAAQTELLHDGGIHNYLRMLWGKKILEWSRSPGEALDRMIHLNNKYALDGRDPNSYNGILWVLGRYDRPWGPRRPIFGTVRYMSSTNAARKLHVGRYLKRHAPHGKQEVPL